MGQEGPKGITGDQLASLLALSRREVISLANKHIIPRNHDGTYTLGAVSAYIKYLREMVESKAERSRLTKEQADKFALENAKNRGDLVDARDAAVVVENVVLAIRAKVLSLKAKIPPRVVGCNKMTEIEAIVERESHEILAEIAEIDPTVAGGGEEAVLP